VSEAFVKTATDRQPGLMDPREPSTLVPRAPEAGRTMRALTSVQIVIAVALGLVTFAAGDAAAQKKDDKAAKVKVYDFSGDTIEGDLIKPEGSSVDARDFAKHSSLIRIRKDFIAEILKSAEDL
jgi:nucleoid-associated protein YgaU